MKNIKSTAAQISFPVIATLFVYSYFLFFVIDHGFTFSTFIAAGDQFVDASVPIQIQENTTGYDGQFYYRLAIHPLSNQNPAYGITIDSPHYRQQRILYPLIVHILSLGRMETIPVMLVLVNLTALCVMAALGGLLAMRCGKSPWYGLAFSLFPGFYISFSRDLTEILAITFLLAAVFSLPRPGLTVLFLSLAILTKETTLLLAVSILMVAFFEKWEKWQLFTLPPSVYLLWQIFLFIRWGPDHGISLNNIYFPFLNFVNFLIHAINQNEILDILSISFVVLFFVSILYLIVKSPAPAWLKLGWILYSVLIFSLSNNVWIDYKAYLRAIAEWYALGIMIILRRNSSGLVTPTGDKIRAQFT